MQPIQALFQLASKTKSTIKRKALLNQLKLIQTIFSNEQLSITDLSQHVRLSFPTLNPLVLDLVNQEILDAGEKGESIGGRKPVLYQLNDKAFQVLCVEVDRFSVSISVLGNNGKVITPQITYSLEIAKEANKMEDLVDVIQQYLSQYKNLENITGIGISMPGLVNFRDSSNRTFYVGGENICEYIEEKFGKFTTVLNDVKSITMSEMVLGTVGDKKNALVILMDWGIGLGMVVDGSVYMGNDGYSGEMGHMVFVEDGDLCYCGKKGCLETIASGVFLVNQAKNDIRNGMSTLLTQFEDLKHLSPQNIIEVALAGDQYAIDLISELGENLGKAISYLIQILNPESVVLSGKFAKAGELITIPIQRSLNSNTMGALRKSCKIELSTLKESSLAIGLFRYTFEKYFERQLTNLA